MPRSHRFGAYLARLSERTGAAGLPSPQVMQSNGGLIDLTTATRHASRTVLSGPAAGVIGASLWARGEGISHVLTFDMGGTSCDVSLIADGVPGRTAGTEINGHPLHLPMLDIQTVSAGGGSIAWADSGGALRVGPESAGARPGPAAYGFGGTAPTVTDAQVVLGRVAVVGTPGREAPLHTEHAAAAVEALGRTLGLSPAGCAEGIVRVVNHEMARAVRIVSVERGVHPAGATLIAFGGAGPLHACEVGDLLGIGRVIAPACAGVLAALGTLIAGERRDWVQTVLLPITDPTASPRRSARWSTGRAHPARRRHRGCRGLPVRRPVTRPDRAVAGGRTLGSWPTRSGPLIRSGMATQTRPRRSRSSRCASPRNCQARPRRSTHTPRARRCRARR